jgi:hypothetical protein
MAGQVLEARRNMHAAIRLRIRALTARRQPIPKNDRLVHSEAMTFRRLWCRDR